MKIRHIGIILIAIIITSVGIYAMRAKQLIPFNVPVIIVTPTFATDGAH